MIIGESKFLSQIGRVTCIIWWISKVALANASFADSLQFKDHNNVVVVANSDEFSLESSVKDSAQSNSVNVSLNHFSSGWNTDLKVPNWIRNMVSDTVSSSKPRFLFYPTIGYSPETRWEFGVSGLVVFHYKNDTTIRLSEISAFGFYTQNEQLGLWMDHAIFGAKNRYLALGKIRLQNYPLSFYGIGIHSKDEIQAVVPANYYSIRERFVYRVKGNFFAGLELDYQQLSKAQFNWSESFQTNPIPLGGNGSKNLGLGLGLIFDSRHNVLNVRDGYLVELAYLHYGKVFGEQSFPMNTVVFDGRFFKPVFKNQVLAMQLYGQFSSGQVPFNQLSMMGGDMIMRGYYLGRFRDNRYLAAQMEYRFLPFPFSKRLGGAVFGSVGTVSDVMPLQHFKIAGGAGLRYLLFPKKDIFTRIDVGIQKEGYGIYFYIGEAF